MTKLNIEDYMKSEELAAIVERHKKAVYPSHIPGANNIAFDSKIIEKDIPALLQWTHDLECRLELAEDGHKKALAMQDERDALLLQNSEMRKALEIAKPSTIHVVCGHVYGADGKLVEFVDDCARCRIEKILSEGV